MSNFVEKSLQKNAWELASDSGLTLLHSPLLKKQNGLKHAFTTRLGGQSQAPLDSFNLGRHWDTDESRLDAMKNRERLCQVLELDFKRLAVPGQKHTTNIHWIGNDDEFKEGPLHFQSIDALTTNKQQQPLLLHYADCVPVIIFAPEKQALSVIHAGWRGTAGSIVIEAVKNLGERSGARPQEMIAAVGPAIGPCCFEAGEEVAQALSATVSGFEALIKRTAPKPFPDLKAFNALQLLQVGVAEVDVSDWCTSCNTKIFYSHRKESGKTGRQGAIAALV